jgi:hypothetical protein
VAARHAVEGLADRSEVDLAALERDFAALYAPIGRGGAERGRVNRRCPDHFVVKL